MKFLFTISFALLANIAFGQINIAGIITDSNGKPIDSAKVWVKTDTAWTDRKGRFTLTVPSRGSEVQVWHPDYARRSFLPGPVLWFRITLSRSESPMRLLEESAGNG
ncbi:MAG: carboxypeptidase regulatory-like domain-containing protein [Mucilaginibacter polytrichastri]|nr:carboxypeptidase regulatory-like domain-containing protein [Mucilaginibacter polytrichastri]